MEPFARPKSGRLLLETAAVSTAYIVAFLVTEFVLYPLQIKVIPEFQSFAFLVYLPHGVRVLAAWLLGWRSVIALAPGAFVAQYYLFSRATGDISGLAVFVIGIVVGALAFSLFRIAGMNAFAGTDHKPCWECVMAVGVLASVLNAVLSNLVLGTFAIDFMAYLVGDTFGLFTLVLLLVLIFRQFRLRGY